MQLSHITAMMKIPLILWLMILSNLLILWLLLCRFEKLIFPHFKEMIRLNVLSNTTVSVIWSALFMHSYIFHYSRLSLLQGIVLLNFRHSSLGYPLKNIKWLKKWVCNNFSIFLVYLVQIYIEQYICTSKGCWIFMQCCYKRKQTVLI